MGIITKSPGFEGQAGSLCVLGVATCIPGDKSSPWGVLLGTRRQTGDTENMQQGCIFVSTAQLGLSPPHSLDRVRALSWCV